MELTREQMKFLSREGSDHINRLVNDKEYGRGYYILIPKIGSAYRRLENFPDYTFLMVSHIILNSPDKLRLYIEFLSTDELKEILNLFPQLKLYLKD